MTLQTDFSDSSSPPQALYKRAAGEENFWLMAVIYRIFPAPPSPPASWLPSATHGEPRRGSRGTALTARAMLAPNAKHLMLAYNR